MRFCRTQLFLTGVMVAGVLALAGPVRAQAQDDPTTTAPVGTTGQIPSATTTTPPPQLARPYWTSNGGFEADTHNTGYGFFGPQYVRPIRQNLSFVAGANVNYLFYDYATPDGHTTVGAPGLSVRAGPRFGDKNYVQVTAGPSFKRRTIKTKDAANNILGTTNDVVGGVALGADVSVDPTSHNNIYGIVDFNSSDRYTWSRLAYKEQVTNLNWSGKFAHFVGAEVIGQGNQDIHSTQVGAFFEVAHAPSHVSIMIRGGVKRSTFPFGPSQTGPWFAIGFWQRLP